MKQQTNENTNKTKIKMEKYAVEWAVQRKIFGENCRDIRDIQPGIIALTQLINILGKVCDYYIFLFLCLFDFVFCV